MPDQTEIDQQQRSVAAYRVTQLSVAGSTASPNSAAEPAGWGLR
jgi:hypothetical protein